MAILDGHASTGEVVCGRRIGELVAVAVDHFVALAQNKHLSLQF